MKKIAIACDHAGYVLKGQIMTHLEAHGYDLKDHGCFTEDSVDYPDYAAPVANDVQQGQADYGILICGTGIGMAITANKFRGIRAASLTDVPSTEMSRKHNDLNVLCLGSRVLGADKALLLVDTFLTTRFEGGRHANRVKKMMAFEV